MNDLSSRQRPDRPDLDADDIQRVYERIGIDSTEELERLVESYMRHRGWDAYESSTDCRTDLVRCFENACIDQSRDPIIPEAVDAAIEDATHWIDDSTDSRRPIGTEIAPRLVTLVGRMVPAYAAQGLSTTGRVSWHPQGE